MWIRVALTALALGVAGDLLLRRIPWGFGAFLWTTLFVLAAVVLVGRYRPEARREAIFPAIAAILAAGGMVWRDSNVLFALDALLLVMFLPLLALGARGMRAHAAGLMQLFVAHVITLVQSIAGFFELFFSDIEWSAMPRGATSRVFGVALRGTLIAAPALILFGILLSNADPAFARVLTDILAFDLQAWILHLLTIVAVAAVCAGFFRSLIGSGAVDWHERPSSLRLPAAETNVALALIDLLFLLFVIVQFRYFFGGASLVQIDRNLNYSEYARRGFFEMVWVVALALPMLLIAEWLVDKTSIRLTRTLIGAQIALILVIAVSAWRRMELYRAEFGLTELRFYTTAFMIWVAILLLWFSVTVLTGHRERFAIGALVSAVALVVVLHAINPDAYIVETNLARRGQRPFDANYALQLSADATPLIVRNLALLEPCSERRWDRRQGISWRTWNYGRASAIEALQGKRAEIDAMARRCSEERRRGRRYESNATPPMR
ncbi:MAG TPA: DUF4173 domain-containing protein [Thermoanaerobaculia bacterium]|jgi:hypothetical protein